MNMVELASLDMVELPSLDMVKLASLDMVELLFTGLFMQVGTDCSWLDELERCWWNNHDKSTAMFMHDVRE